MKVINSSENIGEKGIGSSQRVDVIRCIFENLFDMTKEPIDEGRTTETVSASFDAAYQLNKCDNMHTHSSQILC